jgi:hypothetical protein
MAVNDDSRFVIDDSRVMLQIVASITDDSGGIIYDQNMFIVQANGWLQWDSIKCSTAVSTNLVR